MVRFLFRAALLAALATSGLRATAADPIPSESLPAPRAVYPPPVPVVPLPVYQRTNPYDVWQLYGVDRQGFFRPRVIYAPSGAYFLYNGEPAPWAPLKQREFMPYIVD